MRFTLMQVDPQRDEDVLFCVSRFVYKNARERTSSLQQPFTITSKFTKLLLVSPFDFNVTTYSFEESFTVVPPLTMRCTLAFLALALATFTSALPHPIDAPSSSSVLLDNRDVLIEERGVNGAANYHAPKNSQGGGSQGGGQDGMQGGMHGGDMKGGKQDRQGMHQQGSPHGGDKGYSGGMGGQQYQQQEGGGEGMGKQGHLHGD